MKKCFLFLAFCLFSLSTSWAQTLCVDMSTYTGAEPLSSGVYVQTNVLGWCVGCPEGLLSDADGDGIYCGTVPGMAGTTTEFLFYVGANFAVREDQGALFALRGMCPDAILDNAEFPNRLTAFDADVTATWEGCPVVADDGGGDDGMMDDDMMDDDADDEDAAADDDDDEDDGDGLDQDAEKKDPLPHVP